MSLFSIISAFHLAQSSNFTVVTAFIEIGRDNWTTYRRSTQEYLKNMEFVLMLDVNMVIFIEEQHVSFVEQLRNRWYPNKTVIEIISLSNLPLSKYRVKMQNVLDNEQDDWLPYWDKGFKSHPEAVYADYDIIMNSKPYFLQRAAQRNKFHSEWFVWLDAGFGHGNRSLFPEDFKWIPGIFLSHLSNFERMVPYLFSNKGTCAVFETIFSPKIDPSIVLTVPY
jgi:protein YibB